MHVAGIYWRESSMPGGHLSSSRAGQRSITQWLGQVRSVVAVPSNQENLHLVGHANGGGEWRRHVWLLSSLLVMVWVSGWG